MLAVKLVLVKVTVSAAEWVPTLAKRLAVKLAKKLAAKLVWELVQEWSVEVSVEELEVGLDHFDPEHDAKVLHISKPDSAHSRTAPALASPSAYSKVSVHFYPILRDVSGGRLCVPNHHTACYLLTINDVYARLPGATA